MFELRINFKECTNCGRCSKIITGFKDPPYNGVIPISDNNINDSGIKPVYSAAIMGCINKAITLTKVPIKL
jgi:hypothetical protein